MQEVETTRSLIKRAKDYWPLVLFTGGVAADHIRRGGKLTDYGKRIKALEGQVQTIYESQSHRDVALSRMMATSDHNRRATEELLTLVKEQGQANASQFQDMARSLGRLEGELKATRKD